MGIGRGRGNTGLDESTRGLSRGQLISGVRRVGGKLVKIPRKRSGGFASLGRKITQSGTFQSAKERAKEVGPEIVVGAIGVVGIINPIAGAVAAKSGERWLKGVAERRYENDLDEQPQLEPYNSEQAVAKRNFTINKKETQPIAGSPPPTKEGSRGTTPGLRSGVFSIPILGDFFALLFGR